MRYARKENGQRLFQVDEFLTAQQIQGYFSRTAAKLKHATSQSAHVTDDNDLLAAQEEEAFTSARASILDQCQLVHPIVYDTLNMICSLYTSNKLTKLSVAQLRSICDFYNMDIEAQSSKRKAPYISFISDIVGSCSCTRSPLNTQEAIQIVKSTCRRLVKARINDCHRRLKYYNNKLQQQLDKLKQLIPTNLLDTITTIADRRANKTTDRVRTEHKQKLTRLQHNKDKKRHKSDENWVRNISSRPLDKTETQVLSYGLKHSVTPKRIPTETIVSSVEAVMSRQRDLSEPAKDNIRSRIASTIQSASIPNSNLTKDEQQALKRLKTDDNIVILPADKGRVTVVMDKTDYYDKMDALVNDKQIYEVLKRDPTPALQRKLNNKLLTLKKTDAFDNQRYYRLRCSVPQPPKLYGLPKLHKPGIPMRPIVSFCGSPTYQLSKYLTTILQPLTDESRRKLQSTENFIDAIKTVQIPDDYKLVSFDVKSLFTSIPLQLALQCTETAIQQSTVTLPLPTEDIMDLLNLCLTSTYFQYNGKHYKQLHGTAMGSPVSVVVAEIVMQNIEERALATCRQTIPLWLRYVDDTFTTVHKDEIDDFHKHLNEQNADIQFTREIEENGKLPFLDCLVSRDINKIRTTVYRKPTHTDRLLDETSYNPTSHKATTIKTLTRRAQLVCDTPDSLSDENKYLDRVFHKNNYNTDFIRRNTHRTTETDRNLTSVTTATLPYIKGTSETIARILQPYNIRVAHKPITTLRHLLTNVKDRDEPNNRQGAIYKIKCSDCQASYIGETGRNLTTRLTEHKRATRNGDVNNHISEHHRLTKHKIDWDSAECLTYSTNYFQRLTLESWYTNLEQKPINRCQQLPAPYKRLIHDEKRSDKRTANRTT
ncbi:hypothetical protein ACROYT_G021476 [Oculina patagonica]